MTKIHVNFDKKIHKPDNNIPINIWKRLLRQRVVVFSFFFVVFNETLQERRQQLSGARKKKHVGLKWFKFSSQMLVSDWLLTSFYPIKYEEEVRTLIYIC